MGAQGLLDVAAHIEVGVGLAPLPIASAQKATLKSGFVGTFSTLIGCRKYMATLPKPVIELPPISTGSQIRITGATTSVTTVLRLGSLASSPVNWPVRAGSPFFVGTSAPNASMEITLDHGGTVTLCTRG